MVLMILMCEKQLSELMIQPNCKLHSEIRSNIRTGYPEKLWNSHPWRYADRTLGILIRLALSRRVDWVTSRGLSKLHYSVT